MTDNLYDILGVSSSAGQDDRKAYRKLAARFHQIEIQIHQQSIVFEIFKRLTRFRDTRA